MKRDETAIAKIESEALALNTISASESQRALFNQASAAISALSSKLELFEKSAKKLKAEINADDKMRRLKEIKANAKLIRAALNDNVNRYNGIMETILADAPGETLAEKYDNYIKSAALE